MYGRGEPVLRGRPIDIDFLGFRSDTYRLQQAGWQIAESRDDRNMEFRIAIRHSGHHLAGMTDPLDRSNMFHYRTEMMHRSIDLRPLRLNISIAVQYQIYAMELPRFVPVDATPVYEEMRKSGNLYDMPYFRPIDEGKEIFLREATVDEIMQIALDKQEPEQARIRAARNAEQRREDYARGGQTKAKLIAV